MVEYRPQHLDLVPFGIFQIYFDNKLFNPSENSKIKDKKHFNKKTVEILLNDLFVLDDQVTIEATIKQYANECNITVQ